jgi:type II secretion system protein J
MTRARSQSGFTLLEMMLALGIVAIMMFITYSVTAQLANDKKAVATASERNLEMRVAMTRVVRDISHAYLSDNEPTDALERRTHFVGKRTGEPILRFSSLAHRVLWADANESSQTIISYTIATDPFERSQKNLVRRESRRLSEEGWDQTPAEVDILIRDVEDVSFQYWDWRDEDWQDEWNSMSGDSERSRLPERVRIIVKVRGRDGKERTFQSQARIMMQEALLHGQ